MRYKILLHIGPHHDVQTTSDGVGEAEAIRNAMVSTGVEYEDLGFVEILGDGETISRLYHSSPSLESWLMPAKRFDRY